MLTNNKINNEELLAQGITSELMEELYNSNLGLLTLMVNKYCFNTENRDDFFQMGYLALDDAVKAYKKRQSEDGFDAKFNTFYTIWLKHYFCEYNRKMQCCMTLPTVRNTVFSQSLDDEDNTLEIPDNSDFVGDVIAQETGSSLIKVIREILDDDAWFLVEQVFVEERSIASVGRDLGLNRDTARKRLLRILRKLERSFKVKQFKEC